MDENEFAKFWMEDDILFFEFKTGVVIDLNAAQQIVAERLQAQNGKSYPILCEFKGVFDIDKEARDYFAQYGSAFANAVGIVSPKNSLPFLMTSFYVRINKPQVLTKVFSDRSAALQFLRTFV